MEEGKEEKVPHVREQGRGPAPLHAFHNHNGREGESRSLAHVEGGMRMLPCGSASARR